MVHLRTHDLERDSGSPDLLLLTNREARISTPHRKRSPRQPGGFLGMTAPTLACPRRWVARLASMCQDTAPALASCVEGRGVNDWKGATVRV